MNLLDFEGDYGRTYDTHIEGLIPAYSALFEIAAATAAALQARAQRVLVVGPGSGTELPGLLSAMPRPPSPWWSRASRCAASARG